MQNYAEITNITERQRAFLNDTINFFNSNNRATTPRNFGLEKCIYSPLGNNCGCAIGRHLPKELAMQLDELSESDISTIFNKHSMLYAQLPTWMKDMQIEFISYVQSLHDNYNFWGENGLSDSGRRMVDRINSNFNL